MPVLATPQVRVVVGAAGVSGPPAGQGYVYFKDINGINQVVFFADVSGVSRPLTSPGGS